jgi:hypothetical protein
MDLEFFLGCVSIGTFALHIEIQVFKEIKIVKILGGAD